MDAQNRSLTWVVCLGAALILVVVASLGMAFYGRGVGLRDRLARETAEISSSPGGRGTYLRREALTQQEFLAAQSAAEAEHLRQSLDEKTRLLEERTALLKQRSTEYLKLKQQFDEASALLLQLLTDAQTRKAPNASNVPPAEDAGELPTADEEPILVVTPEEVARMREDLNRAQILEAGLAAEVDLLQAEVLAAESEIARLQQEARTQAEQLLADERQLREVAEAALVRLGEPAVPLLVEALRDESPEVRRWAALVLADMGPAPAAIAPLMDALNDSDEEVRAAAAQALRAISAGE